MNPKCKTCQKELERVEIKVVTYWWCTECKNLTEIITPKYSWGE